MSCHTCAAHVGGLRVGTLKRASHYRRSSECEIWWFTHNHGCQRDPHPGWTPHQFLPLSPQMDMENYSSTRCGFKLILRMLVLCKIPGIRKSRLSVSLTVLKLKCFSWEVLGSLRTVSVYHLSDLFIFDVKRPTALGPSSMRLLPLLKMIFGAWEYDLWVGVAEG